MILLPRATILQDECNLINETLSNVYMGVYQPRTFDDFLDHSINRFGGTDSNHGAAQSGPTPVDVRYGYFIRAFHFEC